ncbi:MAG: hypothetical protein ACLFSQ_11295 [Candidatus Zixiibacteriota bacterium]
MLITFIIFGFISILLIVNSIFEVVSFDAAYYYIYPLIGLILSVGVPFGIKNISEANELQEHKDEINRLKDELKEQERRIAEDLTTYGNSTHFNDPDNQPMEATKQIKYSPEFDKKKNKDS